MSQAAEKAESIKAAGISLVGGLAATVPLLFASGVAPSASELLSLTSALASCVLFGVTYRCVFGEMAGKGVEFSMFNPCLLNSKEFSQSDFFHTSRG